ncbi:MAG: endonuclease [Myxococcota bacterium]|nr:endonuclease [Myxococcota bacterium]
MAKAACLSILLVIVCQSGCTRNAVQPLRGNLKFASFSKAKKAIYGVFSGYERTFYCNCAYSERRIQPASCGYIPKKLTKRARRTEIEHIVPAAAFGRSFPEWRNGHPKCINKDGRSFRGRQCARKVSLIYRRMESDLYNLVPAIGEVNAERRHYSMGVVQGEPRHFGQCDVEIVDRTVEPSTRIRGDIARIYLYMDWAYPGRGILNSARRKMFEAWSRLDPVDDWERTRMRRIREIQGNDNPFVR